MRSFITITKAFLFCICLIFIWLFVCLFVFKPKIPCPLETLRWDEVREWFTFCYKLKFCLFGIWVKISLYILQVDIHFMGLPFFSCDWSFETEWKIKHWEFIPLHFLKIDETLSTLNDIPNTWNCGYGSYEVKQQSYLWFISSRKLYIKTAGRAFIWPRMKPAS